MEKEFEQGNLFTEEESKDGSEENIFPGGKKSTCARGGRSALCERW